MGKLGSYIKKVEQLKNDTIVVSRDTYLKNLRELAKLRYTVSKVKNKKMEQLRFEYSHFIIKYYFQLGIPKIKGKL